MKNQIKKSQSTEAKNSAVKIKINKNAVKEALENKGKIVDWMSIGR